MSGTPKTLEQCIKEGIRDYLSQKFGTLMLKYRNNEQVQKVLAELWEKITQEKMP